MCLLFSERLLARQFLLLRSRGKGFRCERCGCTDYLQLRKHPRAFRCKGCGCQRSVTAGTAIENSKISLVKWTMIRFIWDQEGLPACSELARHARIAKSSAWHVNQRILGAFFRDLDSSLLGTILATFEFRRPKGSARHDRKPQHVPYLRDFRMKRLNRDRRASYAIDLGDLGYRLAAGPLSPQVVLPETFRWGDYATRDLVELVLKRDHASPCLRWAEKYVDYYLRWTPSHDPLPILLHAPKRSLDELRG